MALGCAAILAASVHVSAAPADGRRGASTSTVEFALRMFGHDVRIGIGAGLQRRLTVDGNVLVADTYVAASETALVGGVPVLIGEHGQGNVCDVSRFVVVFADRSKPRLDEPRQDCLSTTYRIETESVVVERKPSPSGPGRRWTWTPASGFSQPDTEAFVPADMGGWEALRSRAIRHPEWLFGYRDLADTIRARIPGISREALASIIGGPGNIEYRDGYAIAFVCRTHDCEGAGLLIVLDVDARKAWVALKETAGPPTMSPPFDMWPVQAADEIAHFRGVYGDGR